MGTKPGTRAQGHEEIELAEFDPEEAWVAGALVENALSYEDAMESGADLLMDWG